MGAKRGDWLDATAKLLLPQINYFQVVFTLPDYLSALALGNRAQIYNLLFQAAWQALDVTLRQSGKFQPAALMVLHTWNQQLDHHAHLHALVPGGGPALEGGRWIDSQKPYLVDNAILGKCFREKFIHGLRRLFECGELKLEGAWSDLLVADARDQWIDGLETIDWNVFIEGPPNAQSNPEHVLKYLARYMMGGPIADSRLISHEADKVTFSARSKDKRRGNSSEPFTLDGVEFVRRWSMHILPKGFTKTRRYGGYSGGKCSVYLEQCRDLLGLDDELTEVVATEEAAEFEPLRCGRCNCELVHILSNKRPSWQVVFERLYALPNVYSPMWHNAHVGSRFATSSPRPWQPDG
jgi:hypothetical protein